VAVGGDDKASGDVVAEEGDARGMAAIAYRQSAAGADGILGIGERRLRSERDVRQIDAALREVVRGPRLDAAPVRHRRIGDRDSAAGAGGDMELTHRIAADHLDGSDHRAAAGDEQRSAGVGAVGGEVARGNHASGHDRHEVDELLRIQVPQTAEPGYPAAEGAGMAHRIRDFEPAAAAPGPKWPADDRLREIREQSSSLKADP